VNDHGRVLPWINLADAGAAVALAVEGGKPGAAYNIVDDAPLSFSGQSGWSPKPSAHQSRSRCQPG